MVKLLRVADYIMSRENHCISFGDRNSTVSLLGKCTLLPVLKCPHNEIKLKQNKTFPQLFQNCFKTVLFHFHFVVRTVSLPQYLFQATCVNVTKNLNINA